MSVHILGPGAMGSLLAHELALGSKLVPRLIFKTPSALEAYNSRGSSITLTRPNGTDQVSTTVSIPGICRPKDVDRIENLVVATKNYSTVQALARYLPVIDSNTNILFVQNGMGVIPKLQQDFWPNSQKMPNIFKAISTHGAYKTSVNTVHHVGLGELTIAMLPSGLKKIHRSKDAKSRNPLISAISERPPLAARNILHHDFLLKEMEKLLVNACINPLTALYDCLNGELLYGAGVSQTMHRIIVEGVSCLRQEYPVLDTIPEASTFLATDRLLSSVLSICKSTAKNSSSMREDVKRMNHTEIDSINGYISFLGRKHHISTSTNSLMVTLVKNKLGIERARDQIILNQF